jgi:nucleoside-diphosphate-sugar epimerase
LQCKEILRAMSSSDGPTNEHRSETMTETILVTGATGSVGRMVVADLLQKGLRVRGQFSRKPGLSKAVDWRGFNFLRDRDWHSLVEGCDGIIHLAGELSNRQLMHSINVEATEALISAAVQTGAGYFGHASSMVVYGSPVHRQVNENSAVVNPHLPMLPQYYEAPGGLEYARTKILAENVIKKFADRMNIDIYRISKSAGVGLFLEALDWGRPRRVMLLHGRTHYIYEQDCAQAITYLARQGLASRPPRFEIYNICDSTGGAYVDVLRAAAKHGIMVDQLHVPVILEKLKNLLKYKIFPSRNSVSVMELSNQKLLEAGYRFNIGYDRALEMMLLTRQSGGAH